MLLPLKISFLLILFVGLAYALRERIEGHQNLKRIRLALAESGFSLPRQEIRPRHTMEEIDLGRRLLSTIEPLSKLSKSAKLALDGPELMQYLSPGVITPIIHQNATPFKLGNKTYAKVGWEEVESQMIHGREILTAAATLLKQSPALEHEYGLKGIVELGATTTFVAWLQTSAVLNLRKKNIDGALADLRGIATISRMIGDAGTPVAFTMEIGSWTFGGSKLVWEMLQIPGLTDAQLSSLQTICSGDDYIAGIEQAMRIELDRMPDLYIELKKSGHRRVLFDSGDTPTGILGSEPFLVTRSYLWPLLWIDGDLAFLMEQFYSSFEELHKMKKSGKWSDFNLKDAEAQGSVSNYDRWRYPVASVISPIYLFRALLRSATKIEVFRQMCLAAILLERHRLAHGSYPRQLNEVKGSESGEVPHDWYSGAPLKYQRLESGGYLLYSVGVNGADDGGDPTPAKGEDKVSLYSGKDIVWPRAVPD